jgi:rod shape-determining protein MreC
VRGTWSAYAGLRGVQAENELLRRQVIELQGQLQAQRDAAGQGARLAKLLELRDSVPLSTIGARVIGGDASPGFRSVTIDQGSQHGIVRDMPVIAARGVVGRIVRLGARAAVVQLIVDRDAAAGAVIERSRARGLVVGASGDPPLVMRFVSQAADVVVGDDVVTSGIDGVYPKGFVIGKVEAVEREGAAERTIRVRPAVDLTSVEEVLVIVPPSKPAVEGPQ